MTDELLFSRSWFGVVKFNFREMSPGVVGVHVHTPPHTCELFTLKSSQLNDPAFPLWITIRDMAEARYAKKKPTSEILCSECGAFLRLSARHWRGREFCGTCGTFMGRVEV